jgi:hypothetical protein
VHHLQDPLDLAPVVAGRMKMQEAQIGQRRHRQLPHALDGLADIQRAREQSPDVSQDLQ